MDTAAYIQSQLHSRLQKPRRVAAIAPVLPEKEKSNFMQKFLGICILFMAVATFAALIAKGMGYDIREVMSSNHSVKITPMQQPVVERPIHSPDYMSHAQAEAWMSSVDERLDKMEDGYKVWKHRVWLLSIAQNENANISRSIDQRYHGNADSGFITFDESWKLSKMPRTMELTPEQRSELQRNDIK